METRANYILIGAFTLAVILAAFGFVFWFSGPNKTAARRGYDVVFLVRSRGFRAAGRSPSTACASATSPASASTRPIPAR